MLWVIQENLFNEYSYSLFINQLDRLDCNYTIVKILPFTDILLPYDSPVPNHQLTSADSIQFDDEDIIIFGSISLSKIAVKNGWLPGSFLNDNFNFRIWNKVFGNDVLNRDAKITTVADATTFDVKDAEHVFVRPILDDKSLAGTVMSISEFKTWRTEYSNIEPDGRNTPLHKNTEILIATPKKIYSEYRFFIVDHKIVTHSSYKLNGEFIQTLPITNEIQCFVERIMHTWHPADAYVMDVADTPDGLKIIEFNNINSAGFYSADTNLLIQSLIEYNYKRKHNLLDRNIYPFA